MQLVMIFTFGSSCVGEHVKSMSTVSSESDSPFHDVHCVSHTMSTVKPV